MITKESNMLLLQNGQIVNPNTKDYLVTDILVEQGIIQKIGKNAGKRHFKGFPDY